MTTFKLHGAILYFFKCMFTSYKHIHVIPVLLLIKCCIRPRFKTKTKQVYKMNGTHTIYIYIYIMNIYLFRLRYYITTIKRGFFLLIFNVYHSQSLLFVFCLEYVWMKMSHTKKYLKGVLSLLNIIRCLQCTQSVICFCLKFT